MKKQLQVWKLIARSLEQNIPVMLLYVLESAGSSPGREGFSMAVNVMGEMQGSIGGGIMEHKFVEMAKMKLNTGDKETKIYRQIHDKASVQHQSGMICSGEQSNFAYRITLAHKDAVNRIIESLENNKNGRLTLSAHGISFTDDVPEEDFRFESHDEDETDWLYEEKTGYKNVLHIIGAGHCSLALSKIMSNMDFYIHLYDERKELNTFFENEYAHQKTIVDDYRELQNLKQSGNQNYVVVMTLGYRTDDIAVRALMEKDFTYLGVLGSKKKIEKMFAAYRLEGIDESLLNKIHAPVGISINSQTPEEIAVSIAAEIIGVKNALKGREVFE